MRITKLDGLRGIFSLMVVMFHYPQEYLPDWFYNSFLVRESYTFVDFFFVLSGYVIAYNYHSLPSFSAFWTYVKKRFARLFPLLFYSTTVFLLYMVLYYLFTRGLLMNIFPNMFESVSSYDIHEHLLVPIRKYMDSILFLNSTPVLGDGPEDIGMNGPSWSISSEMISYIVFGLLTVLLRKRARVLSFGILIVASAIFLFNTGEFFASGDYGFLRGFVSFNLGYFVWELSKTKFRLNNKLEYLIPILLLVVFYYLHFLGSKSEAGLIFGMFAIPILFSFSILAFIKTNGSISRMLDRKAFQYLGKISYSIYLNHFFLMVLILKPVFKLLPFEHSAFYQMLVLTLFTLVVIVYSHFTYKFVEVKGQKFLKKFFQRIRFIHILPKLNRSV